MLGISYSLQSMLTKGKLRDMSRIYIALQSYSFSGGLNQQSLILDLIQDRESDHQLHLDIVKPKKSINHNKFIINSLSIIPCSIIYL